MDGYGFLSFEAEPVYLARARFYAQNPEAVAVRIEDTVRGIRYTDGYRDAESCFWDSIGKMDRRVARWLMRYYTASAIAYGIQTKDPCWKTMFLAAFDIYMRLIT